MKALLTLSLLILQKENIFSRFKPLFNITVSNTLYHPHLRLLRFC